jgi:hypothetical protein
LFVTQAAQTAIDQFLVSRKIYPQLYKKAYFNRNSYNYLNFVLEARLNNDFGVLDKSFTHLLCSQDIEKGIFILHRRLRFDSQGAMCIHSDLLQEPKGCLNIDFDFRML